MWRQCSNARREGIGMELTTDLRTAAERIADMGAADVVNSAFLAGLSRAAHDVRVIAPLAHHFGSAERAHAWLHVLIQQADEARHEPDGDHAALVGGVAIVAALIEEPHDPGAASAIEAISLAAWPPGG